MTILAGDLGGTKTVLALYRNDAPMNQPTHVHRFASGAYDSLESIIEEFLASHSLEPKAACFGVAGPVVANKARITNLPWIIRAASLSECFSIPTVKLINDVEATAAAVPHFQAEDLFVLNKGTRDPFGTIAVVAPGTGLGIGFLVWVGDRYRPFPTEGGHVSFAPKTHEEWELLGFLEKRFGHVSFERVCSGSGIPNIYEYLRSTGRYSEPEDVRKIITAASDPTPEIVTRGVDGEVEICTATVDMFIRILGGVLGNVALMVLATGGLYLGGGIPPRILKRLQRGDFLASLTDKGRFTELCSNIPVHVILDSQSALHGAAHRAREYR